MTMDVRNAIRNAVEWSLNEDGHAVDPAEFERELEARGFAVVPLRMTEDMGHAADMEFGTEELWAAALAARPRVGKEG